MGESAEACAVLPVASLRFFSALTLCLAALESRTAPRQDLPLHLQNHQWVKQCQRESFATALIVP